MIKRRDYRFLHQDDDGPSSSDSDLSDEDLSGAEEDWPASSHEDDSSQEDEDEDLSDAGDADEDGQVVGDEDGDKNLANGQASSGEEEDEVDREEGGEEEDEIEDPVVAPKSNTKSAEDKLRSTNRTKVDKSDLEYVALKRKRRKSAEPSESEEDKAPARKGRKSAKPDADVAPSRKGRKQAEPSESGEDEGAEKYKNQWAELVDEDEEEQRTDKFADEYVVVRTGSKGQVLKCRICTKTICLSESYMEAHLKSKRHARSLKQMSEGRLRSFINSDGEEEDDAETHAERRSRMLAAANQTGPAGKSGGGRINKGRQRQRLRKQLKLQQGGRPMTGIEAAEQKDGVVGQGGQKKPNRAMRRREKRKEMSNP